MRGYVGVLIAGVVLVSAVAFAAGKVALNVVGDGLKSQVSCPCGTDCKCDANCCCKAK